MRFNNSFSLYHSSQAGSITIYAHSEGSNLDLPYGISKLKDSLSFYSSPLYNTLMPQAFVLMNAELGSEESIVQDLKKLEGVREVFQVYGVYDIVAQLEADTMEKVKETITWKLRKLNGVKSTLTMIVMS